MNNRYKKNKNKKINVLLPLRLFFHAILVCLLAIVLSDGVLKYMTGEPLTD